MAYSVDMMYGGKYCMTCEHWGGEREKTKAVYSEKVVCSDRYLSGACDKKIGKTSTMAQMGACANYEKWHELK